MSDGVALCLAKKYTYVIEGQNLTFIDETKLLRCPYCGHCDLKVTDSRTSPETNAIRRRRECLGCQTRFTTFEVIELTIQVRKRDGSYQDFAQQKLIDGIDAACRHTKISREKAIELASSVTSELVRTQVREIDTVKLGDLVMQRLKQMDRVAYIRFACVYRRFKDFDEIVDEVQSIAEENYEPHEKVAKENLAGAGK